MADRLTIAPITLRAANAFVEAHHRHHGSVRGHKFAVAVADAAGHVRGVAIAGRPVARHLDDGLTLEVLRVCSDGARNACSQLYAACRRIGQAMGYRRFLTYILASENGASVRAAGWAPAAETAARSWDRPKRRRTDKRPTAAKVRYEPEATPCSA